MAIRIERGDLSLGGQYDERFLATHVCGECRGPLGTPFKDGSHWLRCWNDEDHMSFEKVPSQRAAWRRGENPDAEVLWGPPPGQVSALEDPERLAEGQRQMEEMLAERKASGRTTEQDLDDLYG